MSDGLRVDSIGKRYGSARVLTAASLVARPGSITALVGRNGAGKTTFLKICAGWIRADHGTITYRGSIYPRARLHELARKGMCLLPAEQPLLSPSFRLGRQLETIAGPHGSPELEAVVARFRLDPLLSQWPHVLSTGERRRASFAVAELIGPHCLLADEPLRDLAPLDAELVCASLRTLRANGCAIVVTGHDTSAMFELADKIVWMTAGTTHPLGTPAEAREHWQFRQEFLGTASTPAWS